MAGIFISYARETAAKARLIADTLRASGHDVWIDDQLLAHRSFTDAIEEQLDASDVVVVVWSEDATRSEWVRAEANRAREAGKLVQVRLEACRLPMPFDQIHCVDLTSWSGDYEVPHWRSVLASLAAVTGDRRGGLMRASDADQVRPAVAARRGERRQVTALVCDLVDAGPLAAGLDPEDLMQVLEIYQTACDDVIARHGGSVGKYTGHGLLAYFGYPRANEEEAADAVRAGLALLESVRDLDLPGRVSLQMRVGVATGLVVISELVNRGDSQGAGIVGETPNLAAQMQSIAAPNEVMVAATTQRLTEGLFTYRDLGAVSPKGDDRPVRAFSAIEATKVGSRSQARSHAAAAPLFGRERELELMLECWTLACAGEGQVVLVQGEAGIGKSLLVESFRRRAAVTQSLQSTWYCGPNYSGSALHPVIEQFSRAAGFERGDDGETRREKLAVFLDRFGAEGPLANAVLADLLGVPSEGAALTDAMTPDRRKAATLETLLTMMDLASRDQPALFVVEDLHWVDPTTLDLLDRATRMAADRPWLILATARPEFESHWSDQADLTHIQLGRLDRGEAERICAYLGADSLLPADVLRQIIARSDGIPLFVEEMTKSVIEAMAAAPTAKDVANVSIPHTLQDSLVARLDRLGPAKQIACLGAAIGRRFSYELLAAVAPQPASDLRQALRELTKSGLVERSGTPPNSEYVFRHALMRDAAYEALLKREREALHGRIANALIERFPETRQAEPALLAFHLTQSGAIAQAVPLWAEAGQRAASRAAHAEAASHLQNALDLLRRLPADAARIELELQLLLGLAASLAASHGFSVPEVGKALTEARAICDSLGNVAGLFAVLRGICSFSIVAGNAAVAEETAWRCLEIGEQTGQVEHLIEGENPLGYILWMKGDLAAARLHLERAIQLYRDHDGAKLAYPTPLDPLVSSLTALGMVLEAQGDSAGAARAQSDLATHARSLGQSFSLAFALSNHAIHDIANGEYARALAFAEETLVISQANAYDTYTATATLLKGFALGRAGAFDAAIEMSERAIEVHHRAGTLHMLPFCEGELAELKAASGDAASALSVIDNAIAHAVQTGDLFFLSPLYRRRAEILARLPEQDAEAIAAALKQAIAIAEQQGATAFAQRARAQMIGAHA